MRKELQDINGKLAEQEAEQHAQKRNGPSKKNTTCLPNTCAGDRHTLLLLSPLLLSSLIEFSS